MTQHNLVAVYGVRNDAELARERLVRAGIQTSDIQISEPYTTPEHAEPEQSFWGSLFGQIPERERVQYNDEIRNNRAVVTARINGDSYYQAAIDAMESCGPIDMNEHNEAGGAETEHDDAGAETGHDEAGAETEQVIPVVKEQLAVGNRATERRYRIRTYVVEKPVEASVMLHDEHVEIERRPATGSGTMPEEREVEVVEYHEEPVAEKRAQREEEVVVRKKVVDRPETVRGKVGETKVDVEPEPETPTQKPPRR
jgi:hypothetical protein